jgi:hypothetical protein
MYAIAMSIGHAIVASALAVVLYRLLGNWGLDFQCPIIRSPARHSGVTIALPSGLAILVYYILVGFLVLFGLATPLVPKTSVKISSFDLAIIGIMMVGLIRVLTLLSSITTYRTLLIALVLSCALVSYVAFQHPAGVTNAIILATTNNFTGQRDFLLTLTLPFVAILIAAVAELIWWANVRFKDTLSVSVGFVTSLQEVVQKEEVGYTRDKIHQAYIKAIDDVASSEGIWELAWVSSRGAQTDDFYIQLINKTAARIALEKRHISSYHDFELLQPAVKQQYIEFAPRHLELNGMFLIYRGATEGIARFVRNMGFGPGLLMKPPTIRFMIVNRRILITSWPAHDLRYAFGSQIIFRSTMYSRSEDPTRINNYLRLFESLWGQYHMIQTGAILRNLPSACPDVLDVIIDRAGAWTVGGLVKACQARGHSYTDDQVQNAIQALIQTRLVVLQAPDRISRNRNLFIWQDRWLRIHRQDIH